MNGAVKSDGLMSRHVFGSLTVLLTTYIGVIWVSPYPLYDFWPVAGLWAAVGWGGNRLSFVPVVLLFALGFVVDLITGAPVGCWSAVFLLAFLVASIFRKRAMTDALGVIRFAGDLIAFVAAFIFARWLIGAYLGGVETREIVGGFLSAVFLFFPLRFVFRPSSDTRVDS